MYSSIPGVDGEPLRHPGVEIRGQIDAIPLQVDVLVARPAGLSSIRGCWREKSASLGTSQHWGDGGARWIVRGARQRLIPDLQHLLIDELQRDDFSAQKTRCPPAVSTTLR